MTKPDPGGIDCRISMTTQEVDQEPPGIPETVLQGTEAS
jgi:hypothetical protein